MGSGRTSILVGQLLPASFEISAAADIFPPVFAGLGAPSFLFGMPAPSF